MWLIYDTCWYWLFLIMPRTGFLLLPQSKIQSNQCPQEGVTGKGYVMSRWLNRSLERDKVALAFQWMAFQLDYECVCPRGGITHTDAQLRSLCHPCRKLTNYLGGCLGAWVRSATLETSEFILHFWISNMPQSNLSDIWHFHVFLHTFICNLQ